MGEHDMDVKVARIDERMLSLSEDFKEFKTDTRKLLEGISNKIGTQNNAIQRFKNDRKWITMIAGALYGAILAWVEYRVH